jgi:hypothetical protein
LDRQRREDNFDGASLRYRHGSFDDDVIREALRLDAKKAGAANVRSSDTDPRNGLRHISLANYC